METSPLRSNRVAISAENGSECRARLRVRTHRNDLERVRVATLFSAEFLGVSFSLPDYHSKTNDPENTEAESTSSRYNRWNIFSLGRKLKFVLTQDCRFTTSNQGSTKPGRTANPIVLSRSSVAVVSVPRAIRDFLLPGRTPKRVRWI